MEGREIGEHSDSFYIFPDTSNQTKSKIKKFKRLQIILTLLPKELTYTFVFFFFFTFVFFLDRATRDHEPVSQRDNLVSSAELAGCSVALG